MSTDGPEVLTIREVADLLRCSTRTIRRSVERGVIRAIYLVPGGSPRFSREEIMLLIHGRRRQASHLERWHANRGGGIAPVS